MPGEPQEYASTTKLAILVAAAVAALATALPADAQGRLDWRPGAFRLVGNGVPLLFPKLRGSPVAARS